MDDGKNLERVDLEDIDSLGIDYLGASVQFGTPLTNKLRRKYGVFLITTDDEIFLVARCSDLITALDETQTLMEKFKSSGLECDVHISDGCKAILQCTFLAGQEWSEQWMGDNIRVEYDDEYLDDDTE